MELRDWIHKERMTKTQFSKLVHYHPQYVSRVTTNAMRPSERFAMLVEVATKGEVTAIEVMNAKYLDDKKE